MEEQAYNISQISKYIFEFPSIGKKRLLKQVVFSKMEYSPAYNLSLGTVLENGTVNFLDSSNNGDVVKVFSTIINCVKIFSGDFPDRLIFFKGNTEQKTRVYNEILRRHYDEFSIDFNIFGMSMEDGYTTVQKFDKRKNYSEGFYLSVKN
jgi:uncharacterized protein DUF6934